MKIRVEREDGRIETLSLRGRWEAVEGKYQNRISDESGMDYFFTHDGHYDGWGGAVCCDAQTAHDMIASMEQKRKID